MERRSLLRAVTTGGFAATAGCLIQAGGPFSGANSTLTLTNAADRTLSIGVVVEKDGETVYEDTIRLDAGASTDRDVLGDAQYYVTVTVGATSERIATRPICEAASTEIVVRSDTEIVGDVETCE